MSSTASSGRRWDGTPNRPHHRQRALCVASDSPTRLVRSAQPSRCCDCGNRIDWHTRPDARPVSLHPQELDATTVPAASRWHVSSGIAHPAHDGTPWCRIPHLALCPAHSPHPAHPSDRRTAPPPRPEHPPAPRQRHPHPTDTGHSLTRNRPRTVPPGPAHRPGPPRPLPRRPARRHHPVRSPDPAPPPLHPPRPQPQRTGRHMDTRPRHHPTTRTTDHPRRPDGRLRPHPPHLRGTTALAPPTLPRPRRRPGRSRPRPLRLGSLRPPAAPPAHPQPPAHHSPPPHPGTGLRTAHGHAQSNFTETVLRGPVPRIRRAHTASQVPAHPPAENAHRLDIALERHLALATLSNS
ncbi:DUF6083 domain-containing protein [Streptomyces sp. NPDC087532]|uniref:DUF6083 domain-containing protein n=1 Tax=Streptomyces sp. NPDC087532 TaxID=3365795 RepID=UPI0038060D96